MNQEFKTLNAPANFSLDDFNFTLPQNLIAQNPASSRDHSRLLVWKQNIAEHNYVQNLPNIIPKGSLIIVNDSRVIASRLIGHKDSSAKIELLLLEKNDNSDNTNVETWSCIGKPGKKINVGDSIYFKESLTGIIVKKTKGSQSDLPLIEVKLSRQGDSLYDWLDLYGEIPLPPYIHRKNPSEESRVLDRERYQTIYANDIGSVAAPTAGLHFTPTIMDSLKRNECQFERVTLHVGAGTFLPVKNNDLSLHSMHSERYMVPQVTLDSIKKARTEGRKIVVVGTTALRCLEGLHAESQRSNIKIEALANQWLRTNIFIYPKNPTDKFRSWCADAIMTNFHQPSSTLFMLICALIGKSEALAMYQEAIENQYQFFSYGDSSLLWL